MSICQSGVLIALSATAEQLRYEWLEGAELQSVGWPLLQSAWHVAFENQCLSRVEPQGHHRRHLAPAGAETILEAERK